MSFPIVTKDLVKNISGLRPRDHSIQLKTDAGSLYYVKLNFVKHVVELTGCQSQSIEGISDVIPGVYEGGFKVWESTTDLVNLIASSNADVKDKRILDIGCGAGLVGIVALKEGAKFVTFQDFNDSVLLNFTLSNILCNESKETPLEQFEFVDGDWTDVAEKITQKQALYDLIFSSETIYSEENYPKLAKLLESSLDQNGVAYIAGKTYYFGVGGGMRDFEDYINESSSLTCETHSTIDATVQREIVKIKRKL